MSPSRRFSVPRIIPLIRFTACSRDNIRRFRRLRRLRRCPITLRLNRLRRCNIRPPIDSGRIRCFPDFLPHRLRTSFRLRRRIRTDTALRRTRRRRLTPLILRSLVLLLRPRLRQGRWYWFSRLRRLRRRLIRTRFIGCRCSRSPLIRTRWRLRRFLPDSRCRFRRFRRLRESIIYSRCSRCFLPEGLIR